MLDEYDKKRIKGRRVGGWTIHDLTLAIRDHHNPIVYSELRKEIEDYLAEEGL